MRKRNRDASVRGVGLGVGSQCNMNKISGQMGACLCGKGVVGLVMVESGRNDRLKP
jgi:hypothetical protein